MHLPLRHLPAPLQILMPGHLMCKFMKERLEESQNTFRDMVKRDLDKAPEGVNLQVGSVRSAAWTRACLSGLAATMSCCGN